MVKSSVKMGTPSEAWWQGRQVLFFNSPERFRVYGMSLGLYRCLRIERTWYLWVTVSHIFTNSKPFLRGGSWGQNKTFIIRVLARILILIIMVSSLNLNRDPQSLLKSGQNLGPWLVLFRNVLAVLWRDIQAILLVNYVFLSWNRISWGSLKHT